PYRRNGKHLDGEGRVFCASQFQEGKDASSNDRNQQEQGDRLFVDRERRQVEKPLRRILANLGSRDAVFVDQFLVFFRSMVLAHWISALFSTRTRSPSRRRCTPSATTCSPGLTSPLMV